MYVTLIDTKPFLENPNGIVRTIADPSFNPMPNWLHMEHKTFLKGTRIVLGELVEVYKKTIVVYSYTMKTTITVAFDYLVLAFGSTPPDMFRIAPGCTVQERVAQLNAITQSIVEADSVLVAGGGLSAVEQSTELMARFPDKKIMWLTPHFRLSSELRDSAREDVIANVRRTGVQILHGRMTTYERNLDGSYSVTWAEPNGTTTTMNVGVLLDCTGSTPNTDALGGSLLLTGDGYIQTNSKFQCFPSLHTNNAGPTLNPSVSSESLNLDPEEPATPSQERSRRGLLHRSSTDTGKSSSSSKLTSSESQGEVSTRTMKPLPHIFAIGSAATSGRGFRALKIAYTAKQLHRFFLQQEGENTKSEKAVLKHVKKIAQTQLISLGQIAISIVDGRVEEIGESVAAIASESKTLLARALSDTKVNLSSVWLQSPPPGMKDGVLVTAMTQTGIEIVRYLIRRGLPVRVGVPQGLALEQSPWLSVEDSVRELSTWVEFVQFNFEDQGSIDRLFQGVNRLFLTSTVHTEMAKHSIQFIDAAKRNNVKFIGRWSLFSSFFTDDPDLVFHGEPLAPQMQTEIRQALRDSGIPFCWFSSDFTLSTVSFLTFLKPGYFVVTANRNKNCRLSFISLNDIAEVCARCMADPAVLEGRQHVHLSQRQELTETQLLQILREEIPSIDFVELDQPAYFELMLGRGLSPATATMGYNWLATYWQGYHPQIKYFDPEFLTTLLGRDLAPLESWYSTRIRVDDLKTANTDKQDDGFALRLNSGVPVHQELRREDIELGECFAAGASGKVYKGVFKGQDVAVKVYDEEGIAFSIQEFTSELNLLSLLKHENVIACYGGITKPIQGKYFLVIELIPGGSLSDLLADANKPLTEERSLAFAYDIASGMHYIHGLGLIHRDLKPLNLLITSEDRIKIIDFGTSRVAQSDMTSNLGTAQWMPPELFTGTKYTQKADVYAFGIILWQLQSRKIPYEGMPNWQIPVHVSSGGRPDISAVGNGEWEKLIKRCWNQKATARPSFSEILPSLVSLRERSKSVRRTGSGRLLPSAVLSDPPPSQANQTTLIDMCNKLRFGDGPFTGLEVKDRRRHLRLTPRCWVGSEAVSWIVEREHMNRLGASNLIQQMLDARMIVNASKPNNTVFSDDYSFYQFLELLPSEPEQNSSSQATADFEALGRTLASPNIVHSLAELMSALPQVQNEPTYVKALARCLARGPGGHDILLISLLLQRLTASLTSPNQIAGSDSLLFYTVRVALSERLGPAFRDLLGPEVKAFLANKPKKEKTMHKTLHNILVRLEQLCKSQHWLLHTLYAPFRSQLMALPTNVRGVNPNTWFILIYSALTKTVAHFLHTPARLGLGPSTYINELGRALEQRAEQLVRSPILSHSGLFLALDKLTSGGAPPQGLLAEPVPLSSEQVPLELTSTLDLLRVLVPSLQGMLAPADLEPLLAQYNRLTGGVREGIIAAGEMRASKVTWAQQAAAQKDLTFFLFFRNEMCPVDRGWARRWLALSDEIKKHNGTVFLISSWSEQNIHEVVERWGLPRDFFVTDPTNSICKKYDISVMPRSGYIYGVPRPSLLAFDRQLNELYRWTAGCRRDLFMPSNRPLPAQILPNVLRSLDLSTSGRRVSVSMEDLSGSLS